MRLGSTRSLPSPPRTGSSPSITGPQTIPSNSVRRAWPASRSGTTIPTWNISLRLMAGAYQRTAAPSTDRIGSRTSCATSDESRATVAISRPRFAVTGRIPQYGRRGRLLFEHARDESEDPEDHCAATDGEEAQTESETDEVAGERLAIPFVRRAHRSPAPIQERRGAAEPDGVDESGVRRAGRQGLVEHGASP